MIAVIAVIVQYNNKGHCIIIQIKGYAVGQGICQELKCTHSTHFRKTFDGTTCSNEAWCRKGNCVHDSKAPIAPSKQI